MTLRQRCRAFVERPAPAGLGYVPDSIAERILRLTAEGFGPLDHELAELLELCIPETHAAAEALQGEARAYLLESAALLEEVAASR